MGARRFINLGAKTPDVRTPDGTLSVVRDYRTDLDARYEHLEGFLRSKVKLLMGMEVLLRHEGEVERRPPSLRCQPRFVEPGNSGGKSQICVNSLAAAVYCTAKRCVNFTSAQASTSH